MILKRMVVVAMLASIGAGGSAAYGQVEWVQQASSVAWSPRDSAGEVVYDGKMWIFGGYAPHRVNEVWSSMNGVDWTMVTASAGWSGRNLPGSLVYDNKMWIIGGLAGSTEQLASMNDVWSSPDGVNWTQATASAPWAGRGAMGTAVFNDQMWVMGGFKADNHSDFAHYDDVWRSTDGENWERVVEHAPWGPRGMLQSVVFNDKMWVIGGGIYNTTYPQNVEANFNDVWSTTDGINWVKEADAPWAARRFHASLVYDDKMWVIAGFGDNGNRNDVWFSADGVTWELAGETPWAIRHETMSLVFNDSLYMMGGFGNVLYNDVWTYTAVPEPGTVAALLAGGAIGLKRKSK